MIRHCTCCGKPFEPRLRVPDQAFCSSPDCQRTHKRQRQRAKFRSDPDYRINQRAAQQARRSPIRTIGTDLRWHDLRHTWATWQRQAGTPTHELQCLGG